jgi:hypoxanthine phosphoribosyltransferase
VRCVGHYQCFTGLLPVVNSKDSGSGRRIPANFSLVYSHEAIAARVKELGQEASAWCESVWRESRTDILVVPVLRGGMLFFADLVREIAAPVEVSSLRARCEKLSFKPGEKPTVELDLSDLSVKGRVVLVIDDICDSGRTLENLEATLEKAGAREVRTAVLLRRLLTTPSFVPCWVGLQYGGSEWLVGYGMDENERWRNLPGVYAIKKEQ